MKESRAFMTSLYEADTTLRSMKEELKKLEQSLLEQDELTELISQCMLQVNLGSMQNPMPVTMKLMTLSLPVWPDPSRCVDELEAARDREFVAAEGFLTKIEEHAALCEASLKRAADAL